MAELFEVGELFGFIQITGKNNCGLRDSADCYTEPRDLQNPSKDGFPMKQVVVSCSVL